VPRANNSQCAFPLKTWVKTFTFVYLSLVPVDVDADAGADVFSSFAALELDYSAFCVLELQSLAALVCR